MHIFPKWIIMTILYCTQTTGAGIFNQLLVNDCSTCFGTSIRVGLTQLSDFVKQRWIQAKCYLGSGNTNWPRLLEKTNTRVSVLPNGEIELNSLQLIKEEPVLRVFYWAVTFLLSQSDHIHHIQKPLRSNYSIY